MTFQIHALAPERFAPMFDMSESELAAIPARKVLVDECPGFPCRVSLVDARVGETVLLVNYQHQPHASPFRASHAIYVRQHAERAFPGPGEVPPVLTSRLISMRAFDRDHCMIAADVVEGQRLSLAIPEMLENREVAYLHLHNAKPGCFAAKVTRPCTEMIWEI